MAAHSTVKRRRRKTSDRPKKPYGEFPLYPHPLGYWSRKVDGKILHFGRWGRVEKGRLKHLPYESGWREALRLHNDRIDAAKLGEVTECVVQREQVIEAVDDGELRLADLANVFLTARTRKMESGELSPRSFAEYRQATDLLIERFDGDKVVRTLRPRDFESLRADMAKRWGAARLGKFVSLIRAVFGYAVENDLIANPIRFGSEFKRPEKPILRKQKAAGGKKLFTAAEIRTILSALAGEEVTVAAGKSKAKTVMKARNVSIPPNPQLRAAVLLGCNSGLGNTDVSGLQFSHLESRKGWLEFDRQKTGLERRSPLWRETIAAIKAAKPHRPKPKGAEDAGCVFLNRAGRRLVQSTTTSHSDYVSVQFRQVLKTLGINSRRGLNFYAIRHTCLTIGLQTGDRDACKLIAGHASSDILSHYDEDGPSDERLQRVVDHIHAWLFGDAAKGRIA